MKLHNLRRWQATHLLEKLWKYQNGKARFEPLAPAVHGVKPPKHRTVGVSSPKPTYMSVTVRELSDASIPEHHLYLMSCDFDAAFKALPGEQRRALREYLGKTQCSAIFAAKRRHRGYRRTRSENGKTYYFYIEPVCGVTKQLERAAFALLDVCDGPSVERLESGWAFTGIEAA